MGKEEIGASIRQRRATCAALYAVGVTISESGIMLRDLLDGLAKHLDEETFRGLLRELERARIIIIAQSMSGAILRRGPEYRDGLERLRLLGESLK